MSDIVTLLSYYERVMIRRFVTNILDSLAIYFKSCQNKQLLVTVPDLTVTLSDLYSITRRGNPVGPLRIITAMAAEHARMHELCAVIVGSSAARQIIAVTSSGQWLNPSLPFPSTLMCLFDYKKFREILPVTGDSRNLIQRNLNYRVVLSSAHTHLFTRTW